MQKIEAINLTMWDYPVTVVRKEDDIIVWCNHAEAEEEEQHNEINRAEGPDITWTDKLLVCSKCGAWQLIAADDGIWEDSPSEGVHRG